MHDFGEQVRENYRKQGAEAELERVLQLIDSEIADNCFCEDCLVESDRVVRVLKSLRELVVCKKHTENGMKSAGEK